MLARLSADEARALALRAQLFGETPTNLPEPIAVLDRLGAIQLDSVNVLERNHLLVPFARMGPYSVPALFDAIYRQKRGFEYWGHMASWLPIEEYRFFLPRMVRARASERGWWEKVRAEHAQLYPLVLDRVRAEGPIGASAFEDPRGAKPSWWDWKPAKLVLEDLFDQGVLMTADRTAGFARLYDLTERVLPSDVNTSQPDQIEATRHLLLRGLRGLGIATAIEMADYYRLKAVDQVRSALKGLLDDGQVVEVTVERPGSGLENGSESGSEKQYSSPELLSGVLRPPQHRPALLAPFDNLMWERSRVERIFGFRYRVEIYVPEPKRRYGYYVLPLLARGQLGGRADLKLDRKESVLRVRGLWLEGAEPADAEQALEGLAEHLGARDIDLPG
jgi:uncharacterized protein YcaQ